MAKKKYEVTFTVYSGTTWEPGNQTTEVVEAENEFEARKIITSRCNPCFDYVINTIKEVSR